MSPAEAATFFRRVWDELQRSLGQSLGAFGRPGDALTLDYITLFTRGLVSLLILLIFALAYWLLLRLVAGLARRLRLPRDLAGPIRLGLRYVLVLLGGLAILTQFGLSSDLLTSIGLAAALSFFFYLLWLVTGKLLSRSMRYHQLDKSLEQLMRNVLAVVLVAVGVITVLSQFGINVLSLLTALGVVGLAVGFAAQDTLSNLIAGITLLVERPFRLGDWVQVNERVGWVQKITLRTTRIVTRDNALISIPNAKVASHDIINLSGGGALRLGIPVGVAYKASVEEARRVMLPILEAHPKVLKQPGREPRVLLRELGDSSVNLELLYWLAPEDIAGQPGISAALLEACKEALDQAGIEIPFPHLQLFIDEAKGLREVLEPLAPRLGDRPTG